MKDIIIEIAKVLAPSLLNFMLVICIGVITSAIKRSVKNDEIRKFVTDTVKFVEQTCKDIHGDDKLATAELQVSKILEEKGIYLDADELRTLIESAVYELNNALKDKGGDE